MAGGVIENQYIATVVQLRQPGIYDIQRQAVPLQGDVAEDKIAARIEQERHIRKSDLPGFIS